MCRDGVMRLVHIRFTAAVHMRDTVHDMHLQYTDDLCLDILYRLCTLDKTLMYLTMNTIMFGTLIL